MGHGGHPRRRPASQCPDSASSGSINKAGARCASCGLEAQVVGAFPSAAAAVLAFKRPRRGTQTGPSPSEGPGLSPDGHSEGVWPRGTVSHPTGSCGEAGSVHPLPREGPPPPSGVLGVLVPCPGREASGVGAADSILLFRPLWKGGAPRGPCLNPHGVRQCTGFLCFHVNEVP